MINEIAQVNRVTLDITSKPPPPPPRPDRSPARSARAAAPPPLGHGLVTGSATGPRASGAAFTRKEQRAPCGEGVVVDKSQRPTWPIMVKWQAAAGRYCARGPISRSCGRSAVAQPVLQVLADGAAFMVARGNAWPRLVLVTVGLVLVPPTVMVAIEAMLSRPSRRMYLHLTFVGLLVAAFAFQVLKGALVSPFSNTPLPSRLEPLALAYARGPFVPTVLSVLSLIPVLLLVWFSRLLARLSGLAWPGGPAVERGTVPKPAPVVVVIFDGLSAASLVDRQRKIDAQRWPNFAALAEGDLVPQRDDHGSGPNHQSGPDDHDRSASRGGSLPIRADHPRQPVRPARRSVRLQRQGRRSPTSVPTSSVGRLAPHGRRGPDAPREAWRRSCAAGSHRTGRPTTSACRRRRSRGAGGFSRVRRAD